jgi:MFS transporter, Spinster family, sphingosine-1-phosphate transporter
MNKSWALVLLLAAVALLNYLDRQVIFSLLPLLRTDLQLTDGQIGLLGAAFLWVYSFCSLFAGWTAQRFGHRRIILWSLCAWSVVTALTGLATGFAGLAATRAAMGITEAFYIPAGLALVAAAHGDKYRSRAVSLHQSGIYFGILLGGGPGAWAGANFGWRNVFFVLGVIGIGYSLILFRALPADTRTETAGAPITCRRRVRFSGRRGLCRYSRCLRRSALPTGWWRRGCRCICMTGSSSTYRTRVTRRRSSRRWRGCWGMLLGGWLADRVSQRHGRGRLLTQTAGLLFGAVFLIATGAATTAVVLLGSLFLYSFGRGIYDCNVMPVLCDVVEERERSTAYSLLNFAGTFVGGIAAYGAGALRAVIGIDGALLAAGVIVLVSAALLLRVPAAKGQTA